MTSITTMTRPAEDVAAELAGAIEARVFIRLTPGHHDGTMPAEASDEPTDSVGCVIA
ncbi:hypothetical protein OG883_06160 [Streptomyces sp. NBC_01142]|uniref:hypothetical protein n=1 Tax=Streptomyces sp. NBC_01142 TaxID=2975865 RepID=UPI00225BE31C|nr:hypothetical protein [Streptomyces sp. NBC_01142]MCX4819497.1 hypothetical protein [Streptomyces sp. NBC_01142]